MRNKNIKNLDTTGEAPVWGRMLGPIILLFASMYAFREGLLLMVNWWERMPEYNHGYLIPLVAAYLLLLSADRFKQIVPKRSLSGLLVVMFGLVLLVLGRVEHCLYNNSVWFPGNAGRPGYFWVLVGGPLLLYGRLWSIWSL